MCHNDELSCNESQMLKDQRWLLFQRKRQENKQNQFSHAVVYENRSLLNSQRSGQQVVWKIVCNNYSEGTDEEET